MQTCYLLTALSLIMLFVTGLQGYFSFFVLNANHATFALLTVITYLFTETLVIFYFVGIGVSIKDYVREHTADPEFHKRSLAIKRRVYPPLLLNMLFVMILFISGGAVDTGRFPGWAHGVLFLVAIGHFLKVINVQHECFREATYIVLDMSGIKRPTTQG